MLSKVEFRIMDYNSKDTSIFVWFLWNIYLMIRHKNCPAQN